MPEVFNNTQKNGVKDFHRSINSGIKPCAKFNQTAMALVPGTGKHSPSNVKKGL
jgi:hypothetical protein